MELKFHLVFVYIGLNCASLSVVLVFEAEQSYSRIVECSQIIKCPDRTSLYDGSLGIRMKLFVDVSASRGLHQEQKGIRSFSS